MQVGRNEAGANALNAVWTRSAAIDDRRFGWLHRKRFHFRELQLEHFRARRDVTTGSDTRDQIVEAFGEVFKNFAGRGVDMRANVCGVVKLLRHPRARRGGHQFVGPLNRTLHTLFPRRQVEGRAVRRHDPASLDRHRFGHHQHQLVAPDRRHDGQPDAGISRRRFDDHTVLRQQATLFGVFDHGQRDTILDTAAGIGPLEFHPDFHPRIEQSLHANVWRTPYGFENSIGAHGMASPSKGVWPHCTKYETPSRRRSVAVPRCC